jgi:hypothetical protein
MAGHTRGPWRYDGGEIIGDSRIVATMAWCSGMGAEDKANAALVAAAPDMLEALTEVLFEDSTKSEADRIKSRVKARAAIAKATGESETHKAGKGD